MVLVVVCSLAGALGIRVLGRAVKARHRRRGRSRRWASASRCCSRSASRTSRSSADTLGAEALSGGSVLARACSPRSPSAAGCSSASTPASARPRRRSDAARHVPARDLDRAAERRRARDPERGRGDARAPRPGRGRRRRGPRPGHDRGRHVVRVVVDQAVRGRRAGRVPRLRDGGAGAHRAHDLLDRARRRAARLGLPAHGSTGARRRSARSSPRPSSAASACCSASTRPRSAA